MAVNYTTALKTARMTATRDHLANGTLEIQASNGTVLAIFGLSASGGTITDDTWTMTFDNNTVTGESAAGAGTDATKAVVKTSGGVADITDALTVGTSGADINLTNVNIADGQNVTLSSATLQHA